MLGVDRVRLADRGLAALDRALKIDAEYAEALTYKNLIYRERARGHDDEKARERDMAQARSYYKQAMALIKARGDKAGKPGKKGE